MKNSKLRLILAGCVLCAAAMPSSALNKTEDQSAGIMSSADVSEEQAISDGVASIDRVTGTSDGQRHVTEMITARFGVDEALVQDLRAKKLGYGNIYMVMSLAQSMPGGITDENIQKIMALRKGPPVIGWGKVAKKLDLELGATVSGSRKKTAREDDRKATIPPSPEPYGKETKKTQTTEKRKQAGKGGR